MTPVIFVSGLGDSGQFYRVVARWWRRKGFSAHAYVFGWDDYSTDFDEKFAKLLEYIDSLEGEVALVGISAGGTAALNAFIARPKKIAKVAMVSSPFRLYGYTHKAMLESMARAKKAFKHLDAVQKARLLTITGWHDQVVPTDISVLDGVRRRRVLGFSHGSSIVMATLVTPGILKRFLRS